jgi:hypothetical protein
LPNVNKPLKVEEAPCDTETTSHNSENAESSELGGKVGFRIFNTYLFLIQLFELLSSNISFVTQVAIYSY